MFGKAFTNIGMHIGRSMLRTPSYTFSTAMHHLYMLSIIKRNKIKFLINNTHSKSNVYEKFA